MLTRKFIFNVAKRAGVSYRYANPVVRALCEEIGDMLQAGEEASIANFGKFYVKTRPPRKAYDPIHRKPIMVPERHEIMFQPFSDLSEKVLPEKKASVVIEEE